MDLTMIDKFIEQLKISQDGLLLIQGWEKPFGITFEGIDKTLKEFNEHETINEFVKWLKLSHKGIILMCDSEKPYGITFEEMEIISKRFKESKTKKCVKENFSVLPSNTK